MDAKKFISECKRMCAYYDDCNECPTIGTDSRLNICAMMWKMIDLVEEWSKEHSTETRQSEFLKHFPNAAIRGNGVLDVCPARIDTSVVCARGKRCIDCCKEYWNEVIE